MRHSKLQTTYSSHRYNSLMKLISISTSAETNPWLVWCKWMRKAVQGCNISSSLELALTVLSWSKLQAINSNIRCSIFKSRIRSFQPLLSGIMTPDYLDKRLINKTQLWCHLCRSKPTWIQVQTILVVMGIQWTKRAVQAMPTSWLHLNSYNKTRITSLISSLNKSCTPICSPVNNNPWCSAQDPHNSTLNLLIQTWAISVNSTTSVTC